VIELNNVPEYESGRVRNLIWPSPIQRVPVSPVAARSRLRQPSKKTARFTAHNPALMDMQVRKNVATAATVAEKAPAERQQRRVPAGTGSASEQQSHASPGNAGANKVLQNTV